MENQEKRPFEEKLPVMIVAILICIYIANCFTPLRLTNDTIRYINIKEWIEAGQPSGDPAGTDFLPYGYVWFLLLLSKLYLAKSFVISFIQFVYLLGSLWFIKKIFGSAIKGWHLVALCMLNWATLKFVITPLSEMQFLFFSTGALFYFNEFNKNKKLIYLTGFLILSSAAMLTRTIGFLLFIAFVITSVIQYRQVIKATLATNKWIAVGIIPVLILPFLFLKELGISAYMNSHSYYFRPLWEDPFGFFANNLKFHLINWSALFLNAPAPNLHFLGTPGVRNTIYLVAGVVTFVWILYLLFRQRESIPAVVIVYLVCYIGLILNWPLFEPRLWVPIMPFFIAVILQQPKTKRLFQKYILFSYLAVYIIVGVAAAAYYTYTSLNKKALSVKQDAGIWKKEYETYFFGRALSDTTTPVKEPILNILRKYN